MKIENQLVSPNKRYKQKKNLRFTAFPAVAVWRTEKQVVRTKFSISRFFRKTILIVIFILLIVGLFFFFWL